MKSSLDRSGKYERLVYDLASRLILAYDLRTEYAGQSREELWKGCNKELIDAVESFSTKDLIGMVDLSKRIDLSPFLKSSPSNDGSTHAIRTHFAAMALAEMVFQELHASQHQETPSDFSRGYELTVLPPKPSIHVPSRIQPSPSSPQLTSAKLEPSAKSPMRAVAAIFIGFVIGVLGVLMGTNLMRHL